MAPKLQCDEFEQRIQQRLDRRMPVENDRWLSDHASRCDACCQILSDYRLLQTGLNLWATEWSGEGKTKNTLGNADAAKDSVGRRSLVRVAVLAATLLLVLGVGAFHSPRAVHVGQKVQEHSDSHEVALGLSRQTVTPAPSFKSRGERAGMDGRDRLPNEEREAMLHRLVFSQPPSFFEIAQTTPGLVNVVTTAPTRTWNQWSNGLSKTLEPIQPFLQASSQLPGLQGAHYSIEATLELIQQSFVSPPKHRSGLGGVQVPDCGVA